MALSTFSDLKSAVATWLNRSDLTSSIPDFITLSEARFNRDIRTPDMEARATATANAEYLALPDDFLGMRALYLYGPGTVPLDYFAPQQLRTIRASDVAGQPRAYTIADNQIIFAPVPAAEYEVEMLYYARIPALSDSNTSNWLLNQHPDLYLYASLLAAEGFLQNDERIPMWRAMVDRIVGEINTNGAQRRLGSSPLVMRPMVAFQ